MSKTYNISFSKKEIKVINLVGNNKVIPGNNKVTKKQAFEIFKSLLNVKNNQYHDIVLSLFGSLGNIIL